MHLIDITRPVRAGMPVWPGDAPCCLSWTERMAQGGAANVAALSLSAHTGTHADGAYHVLEDGPRIGCAPLDAFAGPARVVAASPGHALDASWAAAVMRESPERLLLRTGCWTDDQTFPTHFPAMTADAARVLVARGLRLFGTDAPSVDAFDAPELAVHRVLLGAGVAILENLLLDETTPGRYELIAFPLRLEEADASPVRAVLRPL